MSGRPDASEYSSYYIPYVNNVPDGEITKVLEQQEVEITNLLNSVTENQAGFRYQPEKWTIKEVVGHLTDTERIMSYRLLCIARGEAEAFPGFDEKTYVHYGQFNRIKWSELIESFVAVRKATLSLLYGLPDDAWLRKGRANGSDVSVRALAYIIAGHAGHHKEVIQKRYIGSPEFPKK